MGKSIRKIIIEYDDGSFTEINDYQIKEMEGLINAIDMMKRAETLWNQLNPLFKKG